MRLRSPAQGKSALFTTSIIGAAQAPLHKLRMPAKKSKRTLRNNLERGYATTSMPRARMNISNDEGASPVVGCVLSLAGDGRVCLGLSIAGRPLPIAPTMATDQQLPTQPPSSPQASLLTPSPPYSQPSVAPCAPLACASPNVGDSPAPPAPAAAATSIQPYLSSPAPAEHPVGIGEEDVFSMDGLAAAVPALAPAPLSSSADAHSEPARGEGSGDVLPFRCPPSPEPALSASRACSLGSSSTAGAKAGWGPGCGCGGGASSSAAGGACGSAAAYCAASASCAIAPSPSPSPTPLAPPSPSPAGVLSYRAAASAPVPICAAASPSCSVSPRVGFSAASPRDEEYEQAAGGSWGRCALASSAPEGMTSPSAWPQLMGTSPSGPSSASLGTSPACANPSDGAGVAPGAACSGSDPARRDGGLAAAAAAVSPSSSSTAAIAGLAEDAAVHGEVAVAEEWPILECGEEEEEEEGVMCAICHGNIQPNEVALVAGCDHAFCSPCILNWALQKNKCPLCLTGFTHLWLYRRIDGTYNDYLIEESVDLLHCAVWFKKAVSSEFVPAAHDDEDEPDDYHEMLQWMYGGGAERAEVRDYYEGMQDDLERGRAGRSRAFGQRKYGSGGFIAAGGARLAARIPQPAPAPTFKKKKGFESKMGFEADGSGCGGGSEGAEGAEEGASTRSNGKKVAGHRKAEKQAMKDAQKEKRRLWAASGAASGA